MKFLSLAGRSYCRRAQFRFTNEKAEPLSSRSAFFGSRDRNPRPEIRIGRNPNLPETEHCPGSRTCNPSTGQHAKVAESHIDIAQWRSCANPESSKHPEMNSGTKKCPKFARGQFRSSCSLTNPERWANDGTCPRSRPVWFFAFHIGNPRHQRFLFPVGRRLVSLDRFGCHCVSPRHPKRLHHGMDRRPARMRHGKCGRDHDMSRASWCPCRGRAVTCRARPYGDDASLRPP